MADTDKLAAEMLAKLSAKDADWQLQCDGWVKSASDLDQPITAETEAILRRNSYGEAATAIRALLEERSAREATLTALEAENKRLQKTNDHYRSGLQTLASTFYKEDQHQDYASHILNSVPARDISRNRRES